MRGEDYVTNTGVQIQLFEAMDTGRRPSPTTTSSSGAMATLCRSAISRCRSRASRRDRADGSRSRRTRRHVGRGRAARSGRARRPPRPCGISTAPARFDPAELAALNARLLHTLRTPASPGGSPRSRWAAASRSGSPCAAISPCSPTRARWRIVADEITPVIEDGATGRAAELPPEPWDEGTWQAWTRAVSAATGAKGRALFHPLRLAPHGPRDRPGAQGPAAAHRPHARATTPQGTGRLTTGACFRPARLRRACRAAACRAHRGRPASAFAARTPPACTSSPARAPCGSGTRS